uniref:AMP-dependent synthetase/ligase domain-containing protein n=1 Tax=Psilocybe cubensis TaxID=181762 RepID=A0A8H7XLR3_PSICU
MVEISLQMPSPTAIQGLSSPTFKAPPFRESFFTVPELYDWHSVHSKDHPYFVYFDETTQTNITMRWSDAVRAVHFIANHVMRTVGEQEHGAAKPLIGLYSSADTLTYILSFVGILRAGYPVFLISKRLAPAALEHLVTKSGVKHVFVAEHDKILSNNIQDIQSKLCARIGVSHIPFWLDTLSPEFVVQKPPMGQYNPEDICLVLHSSGWFNGSTSVERMDSQDVTPCRMAIMYGLSITSRILVAIVFLLIRASGYGERDVCGQIMSTPSIPTAGASVVMESIYPAASGLVLSGLKPSSPPTSIDAENVWKSMVSTQSTFGFVLQSFLGLWSEDPEKVKVLAKLEGVMFAGGPLAREVGDFLARNGVEIFSIFGSSEAGMVCRAFPSKKGLDWEYFALNYVLDPVFRSQPDEKMVELVLKRCQTHTPTKTNTEVNGVPACATGDLLEPHPKNQGLWRYVCRISDRETIGPGGAKVNVVALARILMANPLVAGAVIFSTSDTSSTGINCGTIIEPVGTYTDLSGSDGINRYLELVWPSFEKCNSISTDAARLTREKIIITSSTKPFIYGEKGMPRRKDVLSMYQDEISSLQF